MKKYLVEVKEIYHCYVDVEAEDEETAKGIVEQKLNDDEIDALAMFRDAEREITVCHREQ